MRLRAFRLAHWTPVSSRLAAAAQTGPYGPLLRTAASAAGGRNRVLQFGETTPQPRSCRSPSLSAQRWPASVQPLAMMSTASASGVNIAAGAEPPTLKRFRELCDKVATLGPRLCLPHTRSHSSLPRPLPLPLRQPTPTNPRSLRTASCPFTPGPIASALRAFLRHQHWCLNPPCRTSPSNMPVT